MSVLRLIAEEHELIIDMLDIINSELVRASETGKLDIQTLNSVIDFISLFSNEFHHGKEERFLFKELEMRSPSEEHLQMVNELYEEHRQARALVAKLIDVRDNYFFASEASLITLLQVMKETSDFHTAHAKKEDTVFFPAFRHYYSAQELEAAAEKILEYNAGFMMKRYTRVVGALKNGK